jgi:hypothetical protein
MLEKSHNQSPELNRTRDLSPENAHSPAFLGCLPFSNDRKRQLDVIDKKFGFIVPKYLDIISQKLR